MKRVLLTGASGFIGMPCIAPLLARGYEVHAVSASARHDADVIWHQANLLDTTQVAALLERVRPTHLLHLAWDVTPGTYWSSPGNWQWMDASRALLAAFGANGGARAVLAGTCAEYDPPAGPCSEHATPLAPTTVYGAAKAALSIMLPTFAAQQGIGSTAWARLFYLYGPREHPARLAPTVIQTLMDDHLMPCSHGEQVRDFLHVEDAASALVALLDSPVNGAVNIASGQPITLRALLSTIGEQLGRTHLLQFGARPAGANEPPILTADVTRLAQEVGWTPAIGLEAGLRQTINWWQQEREREAARG
jgi:nucleoside-diphosphate-sugar epimerase